LRSTKENLNETKFQLKLEQGTYRMKAKRVTAWANIFIENLMWNLKFDEKIVTFRNKNNYKLEYNIFK
jgi:hypothetical protein